MGKTADLIIGVSSAIISYRFLRAALSRTEHSLTRLENARNGGVQCPGSDPDCTIRPVGKEIDTRAKYIAEQVWRSSLDPEIKKLAMETLNRKCDGKWCTPPREHLKEVRALTDAVYDPEQEMWGRIEGNFAWVKENVAYRKDHAYVDQFPSARRVKQYKGEDCFPTGTLLLRDDYSLMPVEDVREGMKVWGRDRWSEITRVWYKGILPVTVLRLNNGSEVKLTEGHHLFVAHCSRHANRAPDTAPCSCPVSEREIIRMPIAEVTEGMVLIAPERIPFGKTEMDQGRAYVEGLYLSDGWSDRYRFFISGQDGCPKETQKREVEDICKRLGVRTSWRRKSITIWGKDWALRAHLMGRHAPQKHALDIGLTEEAARELLRGIMADAGDAGGGQGRRQGRTLTSTSRILAIQARVLHRMFGRTCRSSYIENHGGLGKHPIWRLATRVSREDNPDVAAEKLLRISSIEREVLSVPCWDIATDDHYIYLPEYDVTVSNCDGHVILVDSLNLVSGFPVGMRIYATTQGDGDWDHIAGLAEIPPRSGQWYVMDASVDKVREGASVKKIYPGWGAPAKIVRRYVDFQILPGGKVKKIGSGP